MTSPNVFNFLYKERSMKSRAFKDPSDGVVFWGHQNSNEHGVLGGEVNADIGEGNTYVRLKWQRGNNAEISVQGPQPFDFDKAGVIGRALQRASDIVTFWYGYTALGGQHGHDTVFDMLFAQADEQKEWED